MRKFLAYFSILIIYPDSLSAEGMLPKHGEIIISEVMVNPSVGPEWIELKNLTGMEFNLSGCLLSDGGASDHSCIIETVSKLPPGGFFIVTKGDFPADAGINGDYTCSGLLLANSGIEEVKLDCPASASEADTTAGKMLMRTIDSVHFDFTKEGFSKGHSIFFCRFGADIKKLQSGSVFYSSYGVMEYGSPGWDECEMLKSLRRPSPGEAIFTEIMIAPVGGNSEWFEIYNTTGVDLYLSHCRLTKGMFSKEFFILRNEARIEPQAYALFSFERCLNPAGCAPNEFTYEKLSFSNVSFGELSLFCLSDIGTETEIDSISYNSSEEMKTIKRQSLELSVESFDSESNDLIENWCYASGMDIYQSFSGEAHFGTPGKENRCNHLLKEADSVEENDRAEGGFFCGISEGISASAYIFVIILLTVAFGIRIALRGIAQEATHGKHLREGERGEE